MSNLSLSIKEELERQKSWMNVYNKYFQKKELTPNEMKIYFFIIYIADESASTHSQEEFSKDVIIKYESQPELFLTILNSMPFMIPHVCRAIRDHYILTGNAKNGNEFINKYNSELGQFFALPVRI